MESEPQPSPWKIAHLTLSTEGQTRERVTELVAAILGRGGCHTCGRLVALEVEFEGDPGSDLARLGVTSVEAE
jgi:hypothetical protein